MGSALADSWYNRDIFRPYPELLVLLTIATLPHHTPQQVTEQQNLVPVAYSVGYVIVTVLAAVTVATVLPKFLKQDLAVESQKLA